MRRLTNLRIDIKIKSIHQNETAISNEYVLQSNVNNNKNDPNVYNLRGVGIKVIQNNNIDNSNNINRRDDHTHHDNHIGNHLHHNTNENKYNNNSSTERNLNNITNNTVLV